MDVLSRIQRLVRRGWVRFTEKAEDEIDADGLEPEDVLESILNATVITKTLRSRSPKRRRSSEKLYVIESCNNAGTLIYTKGAIVRENGRTVYYIFVSAKRSTRSH